MDGKALRSLLRQAELLRNFNDIISEGGYGRGLGQARVEEHLALCPLQTPPYIKESLTSEATSVRPVLPIDQ